tara:strand:- start:5261 stop:5704 length:444 start_codon:yes stop_codon:yes gene_type:complete
MFRIYLMLFAVGMFMSFIGGAVWYYKDTQERLGILRDNNARLEVAVETSQATIENLAADAAKNAELNRTLTRRLQASSDHLNKLRGRLAEIDLTMEAIQDPEGLEERVNNAVERLISRIESETSNIPESDGPDGVSGESGTEDSSSN